MVCPKMLLAKSRHEVICAVASASLGQPLIMEKCRRLLEKPFEGGAVDVTAMSNETRHVRTAMQRPRYR